ncbi:hypothetical protein OSCI_3880020 [Kamptonema sp. PCC 6506]|nr:hypothetical protein OSCI_3880020 [Kamptonema sp. PCC 6506]
MLRFARNDNKGGSKAGFGITHPTKETGVFDEDTSFIPQTISKTRFLEP